MQSSILDSLLPFTASSPVDPEPQSDWTRLRLLVLGFAAVSVSLGTAVAALGRLGLYALALWLFFARKPGQGPSRSEPQGHWYQRWDYLLLATVAFMGASVLWSSADRMVALWSWSDHARLVTIALLWMLIRDRAEAHCVLRILVAAQLFVVLSSWLLVMQVEVPWALASGAKTDFEVYAS
ncbi:MAG: hypothetical protein ACR2I0_05095 [Rhodoferax sp.]